MRQAQPKPACNAEMKRRLALTMAMVMVMVMLMANSEWFFGPVAGTQTTFGERDGGEKRQGGSATFLVASRLAGRVNWHWMLQPSRRALITISPIGKVELQMEMKERPDERRII